MAPPIIRKVSLLLSDPDTVLDIDENFVLQSSIENAYIEEGDRIFTYDKNHCSKGFTKADFLKHIEKKKEKDKESVLTIVFLKKKDLHHPDIVRYDKVQLHTGKKRLERFAFSLLKRPFSNGCGGWQKCCHALSLV